MSESHGNAGHFDPAALKDRLDINVEDLLQHVEPVFGRPHAVLATGSIAAGLGNPSSDVDLVVLVPSEKVTKFPIVSHEQGRLVDAEYVSLPNQMENCQRLKADLTSGDFVSAAALHSRFASLWTLTRIAIGAEIHADEQATAFIADLQSGWLAKAVAGFWSLEAFRRVTAARWLCDTKPRTAAWRCGQAIIAAVDAVTSIDGDLYCHPKWASEKALRATDPKLKALVSQARARMIEFDPVEVRDFVDSTRVRLEELLMDERLTSLVPTASLRAELRVADDIVIRNLGESLILTRLDLGGVEIRNNTLTLDGAMATWTGGIDERPPPEVIELFKQHFLWLSVYRVRE